MFFCMNLIKFVRIIKIVNNNKNQIEINGKIFDQTISHFMSDIGMQYSPIGL